MKRLFVVILAGFLAVVPVGAAAYSQSKPASFDPQKLAAEIEALLKKIRKARYSLETRAKELRAGIEPAFALVHDEIRFESYPGVLRVASETDLLSPRDPKGVVFKVAPV